MAESYSYTSNSVCIRYRMLQQHYPKASRLFTPVSGTASAHQTQPHHQRHRSPGGIGVGGAGRKRKKKTRWGGIQLEGCLQTTATHATVGVSIKELRRQGFGVAAEVPHLLLVRLRGSHVHILHGDRTTVLELAVQNHLDLLLFLLDLIRGNKFVEAAAHVGALHAEVKSRRPE